MVPMRGTDGVLVEFWQQIDRANLLMVACLFRSFLELDILHINLYNDFEWLGGDKDELGAVRLETTTLEVTFFTS